MRIFPNNEEKQKLNTLFDQFRWYYNSTLSLTFEHEGYDNIIKKGPYKSSYIRDKILRKYSFFEQPHEENKDILLKYFVYDEDQNEDPVPHWWSGKDKPHCRVSRGAVGKFTSSLNSAVSNLKNGNIDGFKMKYKTKKNAKTQNVSFDDDGYPKFIRNIRSCYSYRKRKDGDKKRRTTTTLKDIIENAGSRSLEIIYDIETDKYYLHYPVPITYFPEDDVHNDNQVKYVMKENRVIALDTGVRKFMVGFDPTGKACFIGKGASLELTALLLKIDKELNIEEKRYLWRKVKNLVDEIHWKTISYLIEHYDHIIIPDFRVSEMVRSKKLGRMTKRLLMQFSFYRFRTRLEDKCKRYSKKLYVVEESYTSMTCTSCFEQNKIGSKEDLCCSYCDMKIDRDVAGARNILLKHVELKSVEKD